MFTAVGNYLRSYWESGPEDEKEDAHSSNGPHEKLNGQDESQVDGPRDDEPYKQTLVDVLIVRAMLMKARELPVEIVDVILDNAEYWPHSTVEMDYRQTQNGMLQVHNNRRQGSEENKFLLRSRPLGFLHYPHPNPAAYLTTAAAPQELKIEHPLEKWQKWNSSPEKTLEHPCRKIVFTIVSRDQGWGGDTEDRDTYHGSWTWFDVGLERFEAHSTCKDNCPDSQYREAFEGTDSRAFPICSLRPVIPTLEPAQGQNAEGMKYYHDLHPSDMKIQCNRLDRSSHLQRQQPVRTHVVEWDYKDSINPESFEAQDLERQGRGKASGNGEFVRNLKLGDVVTVWGKARFPGWVNNIEYVKMEVYWAI